MMHLGNLSIKGRGVGWIDHADNRTQHQQVVVIQIDPTRSDSESQRGLLFGHRVMAGVAVEQDQFREQSVAPTLGTSQRVQQLLRGVCLTNGPKAHRVVLAFAPDVVGVDLVVRRLECTEGFNLKGHSRMPRTHDAMGDEAVVITKMTRQAELGLLDRTRCRIEAIGDVLSVRHIGDGVRRHPFSGRTVTAFATDAIGDHVAGPAILRIRVVGMAIKTDLRLMCGLRQAEIFGNPLRLLVEQHRISLRMPIEPRPGCVLVLQHVGLIPGSDRPVAGAAGTVDGPDGLIGGDVGQSGRSGLQTVREHQAEHQACAPDPMGQ